MSTHALAQPNQVSRNSTVTRIEVWTRPTLPDARGHAAAAKAARSGFAATDCRTARVYLLEGTLDSTNVRRASASLLADAVTETSNTGAAPTPAGWTTIEVHPQPGVMDPVAQSVQEAIKSLLGLDVSVSTGARYDVLGVKPTEARSLAAACLANPAIHRIETKPWHPASLPHGTPAAFVKKSIEILGLSRGALQALSRTAHLFLSTEEMLAVQSHYATLGRNPTDIELETLAQSWSEHCVHKTLKATVVYRERGAVAEWRSGALAEVPPNSPPLRHSATPPLFTTARPGHTRNPDGSITIKNLLRSTIAAATHELIADGLDWTLSVFKDNSGVIAFDENWAVNIKVETHNRPSAIEPYGGAATGIGGCVRDVIATGLGSKPIASTDVFCVAEAKKWQSGAETQWQRDCDSDTSPLNHSATQPLPHCTTSPLPPGVLPPQRILHDIVAGVRDYGNRMGIPTVSGGVFFDDRYVGNPLVFCGCVGIMPRTLVHGTVKPNDRIIALGGKTGRDGIHGATFSSAELGHNASTEFAHAVQIGNAIEEKRLLDAILRARHQGTEAPRHQAKQPGPMPLYSAMTDCGAGGFSSAIGEMAGDIGAFVTLEKAPIKYAGLTYTEIWISEAQERIVLAVPAENVPALQRICDEEGVELADLGYFGTPDRAIVLTYEGVEVGRLSTEFLRDGLPMPVREAVWAVKNDLSEAARTHTPAPLRHSTTATLLALLAHPTIASKHAIIRQYDHEVQGATVLKPLVGPLTRGPGDASVIEPVAGSSRGLALSQGLQIGAGDPAVGGDPYQMALSGLDECVRNLVCVGTDPSRIAILDNFCWPSCDKPEHMGALVRACAGCYDGAKAYRTPFVSGKDSLSNQLRYKDPATGEEKLIEIPYTLLITGMGIVPDTSRCVSMDAKRAGNLLLLLGADQPHALGGSILQKITAIGPSPVPAVDLVAGPRTAALVAQCIREGLVASAHDCSEGGSLVAVAEMLIAGNDPSRAGGLVGVDLSLRPAGDDILACAFHEAPSRYVLEATPTHAAAILTHANVAGIAARRIGTLTDSGRCVWSDAGLSENVETLAEAWLG